MTLLPIARYDDTRGCLPAKPSISAPRKQSSRALQQQRQKKADGGWLHSRMIPLLLMSEAKHAALPNRFPLKSGFWFKEFWFKEC